MGSKKGSGSRSKTSSRNSHSSEAVGASPPASRDSPGQVRDALQPSISPISGDQDQAQDQVGSLLSLASELAGVSVPAAGAHIAVPFYKLAADGSTFTTVGSSDYNDATLQVLLSDTSTAGVQSRPQALTPLSSQAGLAYPSYVANHEPALLRSVFRSPAASDAVTSTPVTMPDAKQFGHQVLMFQPAHAGSGFSEGLPPGVTPTFFKEGFPVAPCAIQGQGREGTTATTTSAKFGLPPGLTPTFFKEGLPVAPCANQGQGREGTLTSTSTEFGLPPGSTPTFFKEGLPVAPCANQGREREGTAATTTSGDSVPPGLASSSGLVFTGASSWESTLGRGMPYAAPPGFSASHRSAPPPGFTSADMLRDGMTKVNPAVPSLPDPKGYVTSSRTYPSARSPTGGTRSGRAHVQRVASPPSGMRGVLPSRERVLPPDVSSSSGSECSDDRSTLSRRSRSQDARRRHSTVSSRSSRGRSPPPRRQRRRQSPLKCSRRQSRSPPRDRRQRSRQRSGPGSPPRHDKRHRSRHRSGTGSRSPPRDRRQRSRQRSGLSSSPRRDERHRSRHRSGSGSRGSRKSPRGMYYLDRHRRSPSPHRHRDRRERSPRSRHCRDKGRQTPNPRHHKDKYGHRDNHGRSSSPYRRSVSSRGLVNEVSHVPDRKRRRSPSLHASPADVRVPPAPSGFRARGTGPGLFITWNLR